MKVYTNLLQEWISSASVSKPRTFCFSLSRLFGARKAQEALPLPLWWPFWQEGGVYSSSNYYLWNVSSWVGDMKISQWFMLLLFCITKFGLNSKKYCAIIWVEINVLHQNTEYFLHENSKNWYFSFKQYFFVAKIQRQFHCLQMGQTELLHGCKDRSQV